MPGVQQSSGLPMYFILFLLLALLIAGIIALLHRYQVKNRSDVVDRMAPLAAVDLSFIDQVSPQSSSAAAPVADIPVFTAASAPDAGITDNWQDQVKRLRDDGQDTAAVVVCRQQFPRIQAFQQAAIILRHLIREQVEANHGVVKELKELYRIAVMADLYRNSNPVKPKDARLALQQLLKLEFDYAAIGTRHLRLLTKSDVRHLEQLWGRPAQHQHAEDCPGIRWDELCQ
jgi:hypothetical protein